MITQASEWGNPCSEPHTHHSPCSVVCKKLYCSLFQLPQRPFCAFLSSSPVHSPFFSLYSYCCSVLLPSLASLQDVAELRSLPLTGRPACRAQEHAAGAALARDSASDQILRPLAAEQSEPQAGELHSSAFSQCHWNSHAPVLLYSHLEKKKKNKHNQKNNQQTTCPPLPPKKGKRS